MKYERIFYLSFIFRFCFICMHKDMNLHKYLRSTRIIAITQQIIKRVSLEIFIKTHVLRVFLSVRLTVTFVVLKISLITISIYGLNMDPKFESCFIWTDFLISRETLSHSGAFLSSSCSYFRVASPNVSDKLEFYSRFVRDHASNNVQLCISSRVQSLGS